MTVPSCVRPALLALALALAGPAAARAQETTVKAERQGDAVVVDVEVHVPAPLATTWAVLTDFDHMSHFLSNLTSSTVLSRQGDSLEVEQTGKAKLGFLSFSFGSVRAVDLVPMREIRTRLISGDFKSFDSTTTLVDQGANTLLRYHGAYVTKTWVPPVVGTGTIESETRKQYSQLVAEILRRRTPGAEVRAIPAAASAADGGR